MLKQWELQVKRINSPFTNLSNRPKVIKLRFETKEAAEFVAKDYDLAYETSIYQIEQAKAEERE